MAVLVKQGGRRLSGAVIVLAGTSLPAQNAMARLTSPNATEQQIAALTRMKPDVTAPSGRIRRPIEGGQHLEPLSGPRSASYRFSTNVASATTAGPVCW